MSAEQQSCAEIPIDFKASIEGDDKLLHLYEVDHGASCCAPFKIILYYILEHCTYFPCLTGNVLFVWIMDDYAVGHTELHLGQLSMQGTLNNYMKHHLWHWPKGDNRFIHRLLLSLSVGSKCLFSYCALCCVC